ncbi:hypothetical protein I6G82_02855 [Lysinibacillus macroides]|uniref:virulence-associated E family protein n=1 Tax=Lysinibacillus macroides TaxID=33935 RepID=UPI0006B65175|nr:virulence-associated E family protein [Lysinibacillus macroides]QPR68588.1 hypothetical protein I6G82_02855 [Lysinibacillus macroides]
MINNNSIPKENSSFKNFKYDGTLHVATAQSRKATTWKNTEMLWSDFAKKVSQTTRTPETVAEYKALTKATQDEIKDVGGFVFGSLKGGKRKADSVAWRQALTLDADFIKGDFWDGVSLVFDNSCLVYSTHKHSSSTPRLRLIIPLARPVSPEEYVAVSKKVAEQFGIDFFDDTTYQPHRLMYWPSTSADGEYFFEYQDAEWLNPDDILSLYNDWRDPHEWPESSRQQESRKKMADKQGNPLEKPGMVGAFCRTYTIEEAIETFLSDKYETAGAGRYTYVHGSTTGGLILYEDGLFAYSHHGTDPVSGQLVNSFDLVRLHLFHELDEDSKEGTPVNRKPSQVAFIEWLNSCKEERCQKVRLELKKSNLNTSAFDDFEDLPNDDDALSSMDKLLNDLSCNKKGQVEPTTSNIERIIKTLYSHAFRFDEFSNRAIRVANVPWRQNQQLQSNQFVQWTDEDSNFLLLEIEKLFDISLPFSKGLLVIDKLIQEQTFHPIKDIILSKPWDGIQRAESLFIHYMGAEDCQYVRLATKHFLTGLLKRLWEPGCKFDEALILVGKQGAGKSLIASKLAIKDKWHTDSLTSFDTKKAAEILESKWIIELGELAALRKSEIEEVKRFITSQVDSYRGAYSRKAKDVPRSCGFIGTTNESEFLSDGTGNRRFIPIVCDESKRIKHPGDLTIDDVQQVWAEVYENWLKSNLLKPHFMSKELKELAEEQQRQHTMTDSRLTDVLFYLNKPRPIDFDSNAFWTKEKRIAWINHINGSAEGNYNDLSSEERYEWYKNNHDYVPYSEFEDFKELVIPTRISSQEIMFEALGLDSKSRISPYEAREITKLIRQTGWIQESSQAKKRTKAYGQVKIFSRPTH